MTAGDGDSIEYHASHGLARRLSELANVHGYALTGRLAFHDVGTAIEALRGAAPGGEDRVSMPDLVAMWRHRDDGGASLAIVTLRDLSAAMRRVFRWPIPYGAVEAVQCVIDVAERDGVLVRRR